MEHITQHLITRNPEPAKLELRQHANSDEKAFSEAIDSKKINSRPLEELKEVLRFIMIKIGLRAPNWPDDAEKAVLLEHILSNYGGHTPEELKLAFEMAIAGKIGDNDDFANCYENFSCLYFSKIMTAYRSWAKNTYQHLPKKSEVRISYAQPPDSELDYSREWLETRNLIKDKKMDYRFINPNMYNWTGKRKEMTLTEEESRQYL